MKRPLTTSALLALAVSAALAAPPAAGADDPGWPREVPTSKGGTITVYEPQVESLRGDVVRFRAAVSYQGPDGKDPVFGVTWILGKLVTDRDARTVTTTGPLIERTRFPEITPEREKRFADRVNPALKTWSFTMSLDRFTASLAAAEREQRSAQGLKADPPKILVRNQPSVLIFIDGEPRLQDVPKTSLKRVVNTPVAILFDAKSRQYYTSNGRFWYAAPAATGPYASIPKPPADVERAAREAQASAPNEDVAETSEDDQPKEPPALVVTTEPAELISFDGEPQWTPVTGTNILFAANTGNQIFKDIETQQTYALLTGRWFAAKTFGGPWTYVPADKLPAEFVKIPPESTAGAARVSVAGTDEAEDALLDAQIPQTVAIDRATATLNVTYDGEPRFEQIPDTGVAYALNTPTSVLKVRGRYYACEQAVWYVSSSPDGPWVVSDSRPEEVDDIPPSAPVYNVKYVYVYDSTPSVVYVGYTPGYVGCYPWGPTVVWGTGYAYRPWYGANYYPRPATWGMGVSYSPWTGWSMGLGYSWGFFSYGMNWTSWGGYRPPYYGGGWYGPGGYRPPYYGGGYRPPYGGPGYRPPGYRPPPSYRPPPGGDPRPTPYASNNLYQRPQNLTRNAPAAKLPPYRPTREAPLARPATRDVRPGAGSVPVTRDARPATKEMKTARPNDVYAGRDGNVYRKDAGSSWQKRDKGGWQNDPGAAKQLQKRRSSARPRQPARAELPAEPAPGAQTPDHTSSDRQAEAESSGAGAAGRRRPRQALNGPAGRGKGGAVRRLRTSSGLLLHEGDARGQIELDEGADLVLDLDVAGHFRFGKDLFQLRDEVLLHLDFGLLDGNRLDDERLCRGVGNRSLVVGIRIRLDHLEEPVVDRLQFLLVLVVNGPERLRLRLSEPEVLGDDELLVGGNLLPEDLDLALGRSRGGRLCLLGGGWKRKGDGRNEDK